VLELACGGGRPAIQIPGNSLRPPTFDADFRRTWDDGSAEISRYDTIRLRGGALVSGNAVAIVRRQTWSEDERVLNTDVNRPKTDLFPAISMNWVERCGDGPQMRREMTTSALALSSIEGRVSGSVTKVDFSSQSWDGQLFHQLLFDATGIRSHQYSYFESEGDEQVTLSYPNDGVSADGLWFWARHMAAPALTASEERALPLLPSLSSIRSRHLPLNWKHALLSRSAVHTNASGKEVEEWLVRLDGGDSQMFVVEATPPFRVIHWQHSSGERADLISSTREQYDGPGARASLQRP